MKQLSLVILLFCGVGTVAAEPAVASEAYLSEIVQALEVKWPRNRTINIVCHGHSVPAGYFKTPVVDSFNAYPHLLHRALKQQFPHAVINVMVTAIGGESSDAGAKRFKAEVLTHRPDVLLIDYGLNDRRIGLDVAHTAWTEMIEAAKASGTKVLLLTPTGDQRARVKQADDPLVQHAEQIRGLATEHGVGLADSFAAFGRYSGPLKDLMSQTNHPNRKGHDLVVGELLKWFPLAADAQTAD